MYILRLVGIVVVIAALMLLVFRFTMPAISRAAERKQTGVTFVLVTLQFLVFAVAFTLMMVVALGFLSNYTNLF